MIILNQDELARVLRQHSGNPFLDTMVDLQDLFSTLAEYQKYKPFIKRYSDTSLSDLKDKIKAYLPEAIDKNGNIDFSKLEELASQGNSLAEHILTIKQHRENFVNAPVKGKIEAIKNEALNDILSGNKLTKEATIIKKLQQFDELLKKSNIPEDWKMLFSLNKEAFLNKPELLAYIMSIFNNQQPLQNNLINNTQPIQNTNTSEAEYIKSIIENNPSQTSTSEAEYIKSIIENNPSQNLTPEEKKKYAINKLKQILETKKKSTKTKATKQRKQSLKQLIQEHSAKQQTTNSSTYTTTPQQNHNNLLSIFYNSIFHPSHPIFTPINDLIKGR